jgi:hypothetical protein
MLAVRKKMPSHGLRGSPIGANGLQSGTTGKDASREQRTQLEPTPVWA